jgi:hypothetical protein
MKYKLTRTCGDCFNVETIMLSKIEAAFETYNSKSIWNLECSKCQSTKCQSVGKEEPKLDKELLDIWGNDSDLTFSEQDQELFLAEFEYFPLLLEAIDQNVYNINKTNILVEAICVILYDNSVSMEQFSDIENQERERVARLVRPELIKRKNLIIQAGDSVMEYVRNIVNPQIGIEN